MKKSAISLILILIVISPVSLLAQDLNPVLTFKEDPKTHNMHICSDGKFFYTVNGGKAEEGQIGKYSLSGNLIAFYPMELDMRSVMYNKKDKSLYINCYDKNIYRITDLENGTYQLVYEGIYSNEQACLALSPNGKYLYEQDNGTLMVYDFKTGKLKNTFYGLKHGDDFISGSNAIAASKKKLYIFDGNAQSIFVYNLKGEYQKKVNISKGSYGFSVSYANGLVFISEDGNYATGTWYGYSIK